MPFERGEAEPGPGEGHATRRRPRPGHVSSQRSYHMGLFSSSMALDSFDDLFVEQLQDLYDAEQRLTKALPQMAGAAHSTALRAAFEEHFRQTQGHVSRLEQVFRMLGKSPQARTCEAIKGLVEEGSEVISAKGDPNVKDAALIAAAQRVEHYEIAGYGTARTFARVPRWRV